MTIAIVDTGIDETNAEFAGRLDPASTDIAGNRGVQQEDDHGTNVALVAAGGRNNRGILGIAWEASVMALRTDSPGSCASEDPTDPSLGCFFNDRDIADAIDYARVNGARVVNLSLGGGAPGAAVGQAVARAAAAGMVIVVAAGNDGDSTDPDIDPTSPDPFAQALRDAGGGAVVIVGSVDDADVISAFSNRAGRSRRAYLTAQGENICCVYDGSDIFTDGEGFAYLFSGTSFAAPQVAGAAALLAQAFPDLTGDEIVSILLESARDAGEAGIDATYGRGVLDIARAFEPLGATALAGTTNGTLPLDEAIATTSGPMGDAGGATSLAAVVLDKYRRAFDVDLGRAVAGAAQSRRLERAVAAGARNVTLGSDAISLAFSVDRNGRAGDLRVPQPLRLAEEDAQAARVLAARVAMKLSPDDTVAFAFNQGSDGIVAQLQGQDRPAFMVAASGAGDDGLLRVSDAAFAYRRAMGAWGVGVAAESGRVIDAASDSDPFDPLGRDRARSVTLTLDRTFGDLSAAVGLTAMQEDRTLLGARLHEAFGVAGSGTRFLDASAAWRFAPDWQIGASLREGRTAARKGGLLTDGDLASRAWALDLSHSDLFGAGDALALRVSQPLRVEAGALALNLPIAYDYADRTTTFGQRRLDLAPSGRELMGELAWRGSVAGGQGGASLFYRRQPGHYADASADAGVALSWTRSF